jgi:hypothetical protein
MESLIELRERQQGLRDYVDDTLRDHSEDDDARGVFVTTHDAAWGHHDVAILDFLLDADAESFYRRMYQAAQCRRYYLLRVLGGMKQSASTLVATVDEFLFYGIASGYEEVAVLLSKIMTKRKHPRLDTNERFAYSSLVRLMIDPDAGSALREEHERALAAANRGDPRLRCVLDIQARDGKAFRESFHALLEARQVEIESHAVVRKADEFIFIEGLSLLRIAEGRGVPMAISNPQVPRELLGRPSGPPPEEGYPKLTDAQVQMLRQKYGK